METWIRLANAEVSPRLTKPLMERFLDAEALFSAKASEIETVPGMTSIAAGRLLDPAFAPTQAQLDAIESLNLSVVPFTSASYPSKLRDIEDPPAVLFTRGELTGDDSHCVAIVGSRQSSPYGVAVAARLCRDIARAGLTVLSGGAIGIDTSAHSAAVQAGGRTIAVLGCGLDVAYPASNQGLFRRIVEEGRGAIISEYAPGTAPEAWRFPQRNRIISGMSLGVVVVEAGVQSGALLTAGLAAEQGRDVMAVPGNVDQPASKGCNGLIRDGAVLVEDAQDIFHALGILTLSTPTEKAAKPPTPPANVSDLQKRIIERLSLQPKHVDSIAADLQMPPSEVGVQMTLLELTGLAKRLPGNCYVRVW